ncbi:MAG: efflux RND transporter periplasmic adaptor subunit [Parvibaculaceae bacterium]
MTRNRAIGIGAAIVALFLVIYFWRMYQQSGNDHHPTAVVEVMPAASQDVEVRISALGTLDGNQSITVAPEIAGIVTSIDFTDGQRVNQGDTIISIDSGSLKARLMQAEARVTLSRANYDRASRLRTQGSGTERALDEALNDKSSAEADVAAAKADLDKANIRAPFTGLIGLRQVSLGQYLQPGAPIATLADVDHMRMDFRVSETYLTAINKGQSVNVTFDAMPNETFTGTITAIDPVIDVSGRAISVRAALTNNEGKLRPGIFGRVTIITDTRHSVVLPESALVPQKTGDKAVFVVEDQGEKGKIAKLRTVVTGERMAGSVEIRSGIKEGDIIITAGQLKIRPDDAVEPQAPEAQNVPAAEHKN